jgi:signal peptidase I
MPSEETPWYLRLKRMASKFWHAESSRGAMVRDIVVAAVGVGILLTSIWAYSGQPFPSQAPLVVVESGSMMHGPYRSGALHDQTGWGTPSFGRVGTIDPGDLVFVKRVTKTSQIETAFGFGSRDGYGGHGDVIVYNPFGRSGTPIIHRAMLLVEDTSGLDGCMPGSSCVFKIPEACDPGFKDFVRRGADRVDEYCAGTDQPIELELERDGLRLRMRNYPCAGSGCSTFYTSYLTQGDNNQLSDQQAENGACYEERASFCNSAPVRIEWIVGKARGEVPWFGLIKLSLYGNARYKPETDPTLDSNWHILRATAPYDIWLSLFISLGVVAAIPVGIDFAVGWIRKRRGGNDVDGSRPPH